MSEEKMCPILLASFMRAMTEGEMTGHESALCKGENCAFWHSEGHCCSMASIARSLGYMSNTASG